MRHEQSISKSFSSNAERYLTSPVHSAGADLDFLARSVAALDQPKVLDLGCGAGHASFATAPFAREVIAFDLTAGMLEVTAAAAKERGFSNISTTQGPVEELPFDSQQFDFVVSRYSAHHWKDVPRALQEVKRLLKPGGQVYVIDTTGAPSPLLDTHLQSVELLRDPSHVRSYTDLNGFHSRRPRSMRASNRNGAWPLNFPPGYPGLVLRQRAKLPYVPFGQAHRSKYGITSSYKTISRLSWMLG